MRSGGASCQHVLGHLLRRAAERLGTPRFRERLRVEGAPSIMDVANMVIEGQLSRRAIESGPR